MREIRSKSYKLLECSAHGGVMKRFDLAINDRAGILDIPKLKEKYKAGACISYFCMQKDYREGDKPKSQWKMKDDWAWFVGKNRDPIRLTTKPEPYTLQKALHLVQ